MEGPKLSKPPNSRYTCEYCEHKVYIGIGIGNPQYACDILIDDNRISNTILNNLRPPDKCPFLLKQMRKDKLNNIFYVDRKI